MKRTISILLFFCLTVVSHGKIIRDNYQGVRPLGMGNAFIAIADDNNALWYNPAGLARIEGVHFNLIDFEMGVDSQDTLSRVWDGVMSGDFDNIVRDDSQFTRLSIRPQLLTPYFGFSVYDNVNGFFEFKDLESINAEVDVYFYNDIGAQFGVGIPFGDYFSAGISLRVFQRTAVDAFLTTQTLLDQLEITTTDFRQAVYDNIRNLAGTGWGIGATAGAMLRIPTSRGAPEVVLAAVIEDVGNTQMRTLGNATPPPNIAQSIHFGAALKYKSGRRNQFNLAVDMRHWEKLGEPISKLIHIGMEYQTPIFEARLGLNQGYPTAGFSIKFPPHTQIQFATHGMELGESVLNRSQRWYTLKLIIGFSPL